MAARSRMRAIEDLCDRTFDGVAYGYWVAVMRADAPEAEAMRKAAKSEFEELLGVLERELGSNDFLCGGLSLADMTAICYVASAPAMQIDLPRFVRLAGWLERMRSLPVVKNDLERFAKAMSEVHDIRSELEGPDGRVHWRDSRLEWPIRHGFVDFIAREFHARRMMFPPDAA
jgi:glutathione S-transferase